MAHAAQAASAAAAAASADRKRVKVYELKNNDWYDRGTGFCTGQYLNQPDSQPETLDARIVVVSEDEPNRTLLETQITKDDGYQKQQDTLIVWTENTGVDMALSFQEADGCASTWDFVSEVQSRLAALAPDDTLSDDILDHMHSVGLPEPQLGRLDEVENAMRGITASVHAREALGKWVLSQDYILKLGALVARAEELESTPDLHRLCTIMKHLILINDSALIEFAVTDKAIMGVVGALEYDPDFPSHRANHRQWLSDTSRFKEVVPIVKDEIRTKIHWTYRLLYLKDVVLARILDDPTFSVLNGLIFFHQVDIVNHLQQTPEFLKQLFDLAAADDEKPEKRKEAVLFIQNCCAVSKNIQAPNRAQLYQNFIQHGLFSVITFALRHQDASVRVAGTDILVALIDHDPHLVRSHIFAAIKDKSVPLTDTLIELLLVEVDLGVKSQMADAIKILLDPTTTQMGIEMMNRAGAANAELVAKQRAGGAGAQAHQQQGNQNPQTNAFIDSFYESSAKRLFAPLKGLEHRKSMSNLTVQETSLYTHLVDVLCFFVRQHSYKSKLFILSENLHSRVAQLLACPQKYMKLIALKWFRTCVGLQDEFHNRQMIQNSLFDPILGIVEETMPRDNLLNSACLELFEYVKREGVKQIILHLVENYRDRLMRISYVNTFQALVLKYEQLTSPYPMANGSEENSFAAQEGTPQRTVNGRQSFHGLKEMDGDEEAYFEGDDDVEDDEGLPIAVKQSMVNGASPVRPLVSYPDDDDAEDSVDILASSPEAKKEKKSSSSNSDGQRTLTDPTEETLAEAMDEDSMSSDAVEGEAQRGRNRTPVPIQGSPGKQDSTPEPPAMKRRREDDDEDELGKMMGGVKRRNSSASLSGKAAQLQMDSAVNSPMLGHDGAQESDGHVTNSQAAYGHAHGNSHILRRKGSLRTKNESAATAHKFAIKPVGQTNAISQGEDDVDELAGNDKEESKQSADPGGGSGG